MSIYNSEIFSVYVSLIINLQALNVYGVIADNYQLKSSLIG